MDDILGQVIMTDELAHLFGSLLKRAETYTVQKGDTFDKIVKVHPTAVKNNLILQELLAANPGVEPSKLQIGQSIVIPVGDALSEIRRSREAPRSSSSDKLEAQIDAAFASAASSNGVSEAILRGIAMVESRGDVCAESGSGAQGLMQLMPQIQRAYGVTDPFDPVSSIWGAAAHLNAMMRAAADLLKYTPNSDVEKVALTMYNFGEAAYRNVVRSGGSLPRESVEYAEKVRAAAGSRPQYTCNQTLV